jgi:hypothetical protein
MISMSTDVRVHGRFALSTTSKGKPFKYEHEAEHRGSGIVAIYSYGPAREHDALVAEAKRAMHDRFGVSGAVTSGGISGWPDRRPTPDPNWQTATVETQTIFCIDAVGGPNRPKMKEVSASGADWHAAYVVDVGQAYLGHGEVNRYFTGALEDEDDWRERLDKDVCEALADDAPEADTAAVLELKVRAVPQGRYWFLADGDPIVEIDRFEVTP